MDTAESVSVDNGVAESVSMDNGVAESVSMDNGVAVAKNLNIFSNYIFLTNTRNKRAALLWEFLANLFLYRLLCSKTPNQFIVYTTHFRSVYVPKSRAL